MKSKIVMSFIFLATLATILFFPKADSRSIPSLPPETPVVGKKAKIEVVFVLDTTSSMSGMIQAAKDKIWSIASTMAQAEPAPEIRMGLVAFRDKGDRYVTKKVDLSTDLDSMYSTLMDFRADGGGDGPESVNQALFEAVNHMAWSQDQDSYKVIFLVGDAPPHMDYQDDVKYPVTLKAAADKGIIVNTIRCGQNHDTKRYWDQMAQLSQGRSFDVDQQGSAVAMVTPFDEELAKLSASLDRTRLFFGDKSTREAYETKVEASDKLSAVAAPSVQARRAEFNLTVSGRRNLLGENELVSAVEEGSVTLEDLPEEHLPEILKDVNEDERQQTVDRLIKQRQDIVKKMQTLSEERSAYIDEELKKEKDLDESLDYRLYSTVKEQAADKGIEYKSGPAY